MTSLRLALSFAVIAALPSCSRVTLNGESRASSADCSGGLICVGMRCSTGTAGYRPTGKVCIVSDCRTQTDCVGTQMCTAGQCVCTTDTDCGFGLRCNAGNCVRCIADTDCAAMQTCDNGVCRPPCVDAFDCPDFYACSAGHCSFVGCMTDKECAIFVRDVRARCDTTVKSCYLPCSGDTECGGLVNGAWAGQVCANGRCENVGCDTDSDCQLFLPTGSFGTCTTPPPP